MVREDVRPTPERRARRVWSEGPGPALRLAGHLFALASGCRNLAYDAGLAGPEEAGVPVLSVGGITVGGSGKTPVAARAARWARSEGARPAVVTHGYPDELALHRFLNPEVPALGHRDRVRAARHAAGRGADLVVVDDGFQHRRLARDLDWVVLDEEALARPWRTLPSGPAREAWSSLSRADAVILSRRTDTPGEEGGGAVPRSAAERIRRQFPLAAVARCELRPGPLEPVNAVAEARGEPDPRVSFASIMKGEDVLHALRQRRPGIEREYLFPDHHRPSDARVEEMVRLAGGAGIVGTRKDVVKVQERVGERTPLWSTEEEVVWTSGRAGLERQLGEIAGWA